MGLDPDAAACFLDERGHDAVRGADGPAGRAGHEGRLRNRSGTDAAPAPASRLPVYPRIDNVPAGTVRPFWSVMIPTYNSGRYLRRTLLSVLEQAPAQEDMQIEVVDDCSDADDPEAVVAELRDGRVSVFRHERRVGPPENFTTCIRRSRGHWIHILHSDDMVFNGFYRHLRPADGEEPAVAAAFCRSVFIDENDHWLHLLRPESRTPGVLPDLIERLAVMNLIVATSIVVRRRAYETLGGFHPDLFHSADWDMWKRIATRYPVWYEPRPMTLYRVHSESDTSRLVSSGANVSEAMAAIEIARSYLPASRVRELTRRAREQHALYAMARARSLLVEGDRAAAFAQVREGLKCSSSTRVCASLVAQSLKALRRRRRNARDGRRPARA